MDVVDKGSKIHQILGSFNFEKVHKVMTALGWHWWDGKGPNGVPTLEQLQQVASKMLLDIIDKPFGSASELGGFRVSRTNIEGDDSIKLMFVLESSESE